MHYGQIEWNNREDDPDFKRWSLEVKKRDNFTCQICGIRGVYLESHHMNSWDWCVKERYEVDNGVSLCKPCHHDRFHKQYGYGNNTKFQYQEFKRLVDLFKTVIKKEIESYGLEVNTSNE